jgi:hypothetical protein
MEFGFGNANNGPTTTLYWTAGPLGENGGTFGTLTANPSSVSATVASQLSVSISPTASLGNFVAGVGATYTSTAVADVISTAGSATLTVADLSGLGKPGFLYNPSGSGFSLASALTAAGASSGVGATGSAASAVSATPLTLVTYSQPISNDTPTITLAQAIGASDPLRTGSYSKTLTFTLSTTSP